MWGLGACRGPSSSGAAVGAQAALRSRGCGDAGHGEEHVQDRDLRPRQASSAQGHVREVPASPGASAAGAADAVGPGAS
eukprot:11185540-Lingulodinium_polyedra.AAC.1